MSVYQSIGERLDGFTLDMLGKDKMCELAAEFLDVPYESGMPQLQAIADSENGLALFTAWLRQDYRYKDMTLLEHFRGSKPVLTADETMQLDQMIRTSFMSAFRLGEVRPGDIELEDLRSGARYHVREYSLASQIVSGQFLIVRLCQQVGHWEIIMPDGSIAPFTLESERLVEQLVGELPQDMTIQHTTGYIILRSSLGLDPLSKDDDLTPPPKQLSKKEAAAELKTAMRETRIDRYISPDTIIRLLDEEFAAEADPLQPAVGIRVLLGLANQDRAVAERLMTTGMGYWNAHVSKRKLKKARSGGVKISEFDVFAWREKADEAHALMIEQDTTAAVTVYDEMFAIMLKERLVTPSVYRLLTNAAVAQLAEGNALFGQELLDTAQVMCPEYDFAWEQQELVDTGQYRLAALRKQLGGADQDPEAISQKFQDMEDRFGPPPETVRGYTDKQLLHEFSEHGVDIDPKTFAKLAVGYTDLSDLVEKLTDDDAQHIDAVYMLLEEARTRWAPEVIWVDTLHGLAMDYDRVFYDEEGYPTDGFPGAKAAIGRLSDALEKASDTVVRQWMRDSREYAGYRQNMVFAARTIAHNKPRQTTLIKAAEALCALAHQRTGDIIFTVPSVLRQVASVDFATAQKHLDDLAGKAPQDSTALQIIGDELAHTNPEVAAYAYERSLAALDDRRRKKLWQHAPYSYETLAESYEYLGEMLDETYAALDRESDRRKLSKKLREIETDKQLAHNETTDKIERRFQTLLAEEAGDSPIPAYLRWFETLEIDLSDGDGFATRLDDPTPKSGRNEPCPCGALRPNGLPMKYKNCCGKM